MLYALEEQQSQQKKLDLQRAKQLEEALRSSHWSKDQDMKEMLKNARSYCKANARLLMDDMEITKETETYHVPGKHGKTFLSTRKTITNKAAQKQKKKNERRIAQERALAKLQFDHGMQAITDMMMTKMGQTQQKYVHQEQLERMKVVLPQALHLTPEQRMELLEKTQTLADQCEKYSVRFVRGKTIERVLNPMSKTGRDKLLVYYNNQEIMNKLEQDKTALDNQVQKLMEEYQENRIYGGAGTAQAKRFAARRDKYAEVHGCSREEAETALVRRAAVPATLEHYEENQKAYRALKTRKTTQDFGQYEEVYRHRNYDEEVNHLVKHHKARKHPDMTPQKLEQVTQDYLTRVTENNEFVFRCSPRGFGEFIRDRLKSEPSNEKLEHEEKVYGVKKGTIDPSEYQSYGYLASRDLASYQSDENVGDNIAVVQLNKERMANRVTCTVGWSTAEDRSAIPQLAGAAGLGCVGHDYRRKLTHEALKTNPATDANSVLKAVGADALELQFHGDVTIQDVKSITLVQPAGELDANFEQQDRVQSIIRSLREINENNGSYGRGGMPPLTCKVVKHGRKPGDPAQVGTVNLETGKITFEPAQ